MKITAWSQSRKATYDECPAKAKYKFIDKLPDPGGPAMERGSRLHKLCEDFITGCIQDVPSELIKIRDTLHWLRAHYEQGTCYVEQEIAFNVKWESVGWFAPDAWVRIKMDVIVVEGPLATIIDWKTGKYKPDGEFGDQLNLYAVAALLKNAELQEAEGQLIFLDHTETPVRRPEGLLAREALPAAMKQWEKATVKMLNDEVFHPTPGNGCRWCPYSQKRGGPCKF